MTSQLIVNVIISSALIFMMASGFAVIYRISACLFFLYAAFYTVGAYTVYYLYKVVDISFWLSFFLAVAISAILGVTANILVYMPLKQKKAAPRVILLASLGAYIVLQNIISLIFGDDVRSLHSPAIKAGISLFGARITLSQIAIITAGFIRKYLLIFCSICRFESGKLNPPPDREQLPRRQYK